MSKIGKQPITIPEKVTVKIEEDRIHVQGPLGELEVPTLEGVTVEQSEDKIVCSLKEESKQTRSNWGTLRALIANAIEGVQKDFEKKLLIEGVGYKMTQKGKDIELALGFSHMINFEAPEGITLAIEKDEGVKITGISKSQVGQVAAKIRSLKKPEPYKGKGIRYEGEVIRRKAGKKAATTAAA